MIRAYRREQGSPQQTAVGEVAIANEPTLTDAEIQWQKTYEYHAETVTVVRDPNGNEAQVEGDDTPEVTVFANDVFPPAVPSGLQAVFSGPGQSPFIDLVWAPVTDVRSSRLQRLSPRSRRQAREIELTNRSRLLPIATTTSLPVNATFTP